MTTLTAAHREWASRPADERFSSLADLHAANVKKRSRAMESTLLQINKLKAVVGVSNRIELGSELGDGSLSLNNWSFGQLASRAGGGAEYLRSLPTKLAVECLNHHLPNSLGECKLLIDGDSITARGITSDVYTRIWDADVSERLVELEATTNWRPAPAAFDESRGLYAGDRDMFAFMVDNERRIFETLPGGGLGRGFFMWNSEVGGRSFGISTFLYEYVCGNHRVWGAQNVRTTTFRHVGNGLDQRAFGAFRATIKDYADSSTDNDVQRISRLRTVEIGADKQVILDTLFSKFGLTRRLAAQTYALAEQRTDWYGSPRSVWGITGALTEIARDMPNADSRLETDRLASKIMREYA